MRIASFSTIRNHLTRNHKSNNSTLYEAAAALAIIRFALYAKSAKRNHLNHAFKTGPKIVCLFLRVLSVCRSEAIYPLNPASSSPCMN